MMNTSLKRIEKTNSYSIESTPLKSLKRAFSRKRVTISNLRKTQMHP